jgi:N,N-dimethylformamidase
MATEAEPLAPISLPGTHAYAEKSVSAGDLIQFRISSDGPYRLSIVRLGWDVSGLSRDWVIQQFPESPGAVQSIRPGSYVHVPDALPSSEFPALSLECWVRPWLNKWQGLISQYTYPGTCGFGLFLDPSGKPAFYFGDGGNFQAGWLVTADISIPVNEWTHIAAVFNQGTGTLWIDGIERSTVRGRSTVNPGAAPLRLAAYGASGLTGNSLEGDLAMPAIYGRAMMAPEIQARANTRPPEVPPSTDLLACWPMTEENGQSLADGSPWRRTGQIINRATWMIGGPGFDATAVDRFSLYDPSADPARGHGLRFASEDLFDCRWDITESYSIPTDLPPGVYVGRIQYGPSFTRRNDVTFVVKPAAGKPKAKILVLCSTNTWLAYNVPFPNFPDAVDGWGTGGHGVSVPTAPGFNLYDNYRDSGAPPYQIGVQMPWSAFPYARYIPANDYGHLLRAERPLHVWLEQNGYDYDVASDIDLHQPAMLSDYEIVIINGHSEYWSAEAYNALDSYLSAGGRAVVLSGNTMFWRVSFDAAGEIMECRKLPASVGGRTDTLVGEIYHSHDRARGGLMRECGYPAWRVIGLECIGYDGAFGSYVVQAPQHPFFQSPEPLGVLQGQALGSGAVGHEYDVRLSQIPGPYSPAPPPGPAPQALAQASTDPVNYGTYFDYRANLTGVGGVRSEIIDWQRESGGRVFAAGAIAVGSKLSGDRQLGALLRNVLHHFGVAHRLNLLAVAADGKLYTKWWDGGAWGPSITEWQDLGGNFADTPEAVAWAPDHISLMGIDPTGHLQYKWLDGNEWNPSLTELVDLGGQLEGQPRAVAWGRNRLDIFARGLDGKIYVKWWDGASWGPSTNGWQDMGDDVMHGSPAAIAWQGDHLSVAVVGQDGRLKYKWWDGSSWNPSLTDWVDMGGNNLTFGPAMISWNGNWINIFGVDSGGGLWTKWWDGSAWGPSLSEWAYLGGGVQSAPVVVARGGLELSVFAIGADGRMQAKWWDGSAWGPSQTAWQDLGGNFVGNPAAVTWRGHHVSVMGVGTSGEFLYKFWNGSQWNPADTEWLELGGPLKGQLRASPSALAWV